MANHARAVFFGPQYRGSRRSPATSSFLGNLSDGSWAFRFSTNLLAAFGMESSHIPLYTGYFGLKESPHRSRTTIMPRFGPGKTTTFRSS